jgi:integrase
MGKLRAQQWSDVDMENGILTVTRPKSGKRERVPLNTVAFSVLVEADQSGDLVFPRMPKGMSVTFARYVRKARLEGVTFHCLRDSFVSRLAANANPATIMALARHRDFRTTQRYFRPDDTHLRQAVETLTGDGSGTSTGTNVFMPV